MLQSGARAALSVDARNDIVGIINTLEREYQEGDILVTNTRSMLIFDWYTAGHSLETVPIEVVADPADPKLSDSFENQRLWVFGTHRISELQETVETLRDKGLHQVTCRFDQYGTFIVLLDPTDPTFPVSSPDACLIR
jgi:hypothetical protein